MISLNTKQAFLPLLFLGALLVLVPVISTAAINRDGGDMDGGGVGGGGVGGSTQCNDGTDNDGNGLTDYPSDLGCTSAADPTEAGYSTATQCSDGIDNDSNGFTDFSSDQGCTSAADTTESGYHTQCTDGIDNDSNGVTDFSADQGCTSKTDTTEAGYTVPPVPPPGVQVYKTASKRDFLSKVYVDQLANGGISSETAAHGYPQYPVSQASPTGNRICSLYDPTAYITEWSLGGFDSPGNNNMAAWNPSTSKWYKQSASSFGNKRYNYLTCKTIATPDTSLTATAAGQSGSTLTVSSGTPVTLTWYSQYGQIRQGTMSAVNFSLTTTIPGHFETVTNMTCNDPGGDGWGPDENYNIAQTPSARSLMALPAGCFSSTESVWVPASTASRPLAGSQIVTPTQTTTYTYRGTNANGTSSSSVTVTVTPGGVSQCNDGIDNDGDGPIDYPADSDCTSADDTTEGNAIQCSDGIDNDSDTKIDFPSDLGCSSASDTTEAPDPGQAECNDGYDNNGASGADYPADPSCTSANDTTENGVLPSIQCTVNGGSADITVQPNTQATYAGVNPTNGATTPYTWVPSSQTGCSGTTSQTCTFVNPGPYTMGLKATNMTNPISCPQVTVGCAGIQNINLVPASTRVNDGSSTTLTPTGTGVSGTTCTLTGTNGLNVTLTPNACVLAGTPISTGSITTQTFFTLTCGADSKLVIINVASNQGEF